MKKDTQIEKSQYSSAQFCKHLYVHTCEVYMLCVFCADWHVGFLQERTWLRFGILLEMIVVH